MPVELPGVTAGGWKVEEPSCGGGAATTGAGAGIGAGRGAAACGIGAGRAGSSSESDGNSASETNEHPPNKSTAAKAAGICIRAMGKTTPNKKVITPETNNLIFYGVSEVFTTP